MSTKKSGSKTSQKNQAKVAVSPVVKTKEQVRLTRMRTRDFLADAILKVAKQELAAQKAALADNPDRTPAKITLTDEDCKNGIAALEAVETFYKGFSPVAGGSTESKVFQDIAKGKAIMQGLLTGEVKAMSPKDEAAHKAAKAEAMKKAQEAAAALAALQAADNLL